MFNDNYGIAKNEVDVDLLCSIMAVEAGNLNFHTYVPLTAILEQVNHFDQASSESYDNDWAPDIPLGQIDIVGLPLDKNDIRSLLWAGLKKPAKSGMQFRKGVSCVKVMYKSSSPKGQRQRGWNVFLSGFQSTCSWPGLLPGPRLWPQRRVVQMGNPL